MKYVSARKGKSAYSTLKPCCYNMNVRVSVCAHYYCKGANNKFFFLKVQLRWWVFDLNDYKNVFQCILIPLI